MTAAAIMSLALAMLSIPPNTSMQQLALTFAPLYALYQLAVHAQGKPALFTPPAHNHSCAPFQSALCKYCLVLPLVANLPCMYLWRCKTKVTGCAGSGWPRWQS